MAANNLLKLCAMVQTGLFGFGRKLREEEHGGSEIIAVVAVAVVAVALAIVFRDAVSGFITDAVNKFKEMLGMS